MADKLIIFRRLEAMKFIIDFYHYLVISTQVTLETIRKFFENKRGKISEEHWLLLSIARVSL